MAEWIGFVGSRSATLVGEAVRPTFALAAARAVGGSYVPAVARGLAKANGVERGQQA